DALPDEWWPVAAAVTTTLLDDAEAAAAVDDTIGAVRGCWSEAARDGLGGPALHAAAQHCFSLATERMPALAVDAAIVAATGSYVARYGGRGRRPADDRLQEWARRPTKSA